MSKEEIEAREIFKDHNPDHLKEVDLVVAEAKSHPELIEKLRRKYEFKNP